MNKHEELAGILQNMSLEQAVKWLKILNGLTEAQKVYVITLLDELFGIRTSDQ